jgi:peptidyl-prolyl cis-trans isomerase SurA
MKKLLKKMNLKSTGEMRILFIILFSFTFILCKAQPGQIIDQVVGVVGNKILLQSEVEAQYQQIVAQGMEKSEILKCRIADQLLVNKLLLHQAQVDSIEVSDAQINNELDRRIGFMVSQIGSESKLEQYYEKSIPEIRDEFKPLIKDQLMIQNMQGKVASNISVSPAEVKDFFNSIHPDSLPFINAEIEYAQIVMTVPVSAEEKARIREKLEGYRKRVIAGEDFSTLAILYSQDGSARSGGELGFVGRGDLVPEFEAVAFRLRKGDVSEIVETKFGFHIMQLIERRGEQINVRHILLKPTFGQKEINETFARADSIRKLIVNDSLSFADAAQKYSDDHNSRYNGGNVINPKTGIARFETDEVDPSVFFQLDKMSVGEVSAPIQSLSAEGNTAFRILFLKSRTKPHTTNLVEDYQRIQEAALTEKENKVLTDWVKKKMKTTYVQVDEEYRNCPNMNYWFQSNP